MGSLLFHFTRKPTARSVKIASGRGRKLVAGSAGAVLDKILREGRLRGTSRWSHGQKCVCFTEAPIQELRSVFSLVAIAASKKERPRYEPYGIGVSKKWLFAQGGRPVIYDDSEAFGVLPEDLKFRFVPYDPGNNIDYTWEREWRIRTDYLQLDPREALVIVPTSDEAFQLVYEFAD